MNLRKLTTIAGLATVIGLGPCPTSKAQVSCSPKVLARTCKDVASLLDTPLRLKTARGGVQLELVSPAEFEARVNQFKKDLRFGPIETPGCAPGSDKLFFQNCQNIDVLFLRDNPSDRTPKRLLVSSNEAIDALALSYFIQGYYAGLTAAMPEPSK
jgi:hypothetical protein